jgi:hypothetical protein
MPRRIWRRAEILWRRMYEILEHGAIGNRIGLIVGRLIVVLIITNSRHDDARFGACVASAIRAIIHRDSKQCLTRSRYCC